jgi:hypothetical protein
MEHHQSAGDLGLVEVRGAVVPECDVLLVTVVAVDWANDSKRITSLNVGDEQDHWLLVVG